MSSLCAAIVLFVHFGLQYVVADLAMHGTGLADVLLPVMLRPRLPCLFRRLCIFGEVLFAATTPDGRHTRHHYSSRCNSCHSICACISNTLGLERADVVPDFPVHACLTDQCALESRRAIGTWRENKGKGKSQLQHRSQDQTWNPTVCSGSAD